MPRINGWKVELNPFDDNGLYSGWVDVTRDVVFDNLGEITENLDNTDFDVGIFRNSDFGITFRNESGNYSDVDNPKSIFRFRRTGTQFKITWEVDPDCDLETADISDSWISEEVEIFKGILNDDGASEDVETSQINFSVLGRETLLDNDSVPTGGLVNGNLFSAALFTVLNRPVFTGLVTVSALNITCGVDLAIDDVTSFDGQTLLQAVQDLLAASNSVLRIVNDICYVSPRTESVAVVANFYGQGSSAGSENITTVKNIRTGVAKTFNYVLWSGTTNIIEDGTSVGTYGVRKKEVSYNFITDVTKQQDVMQSVVDEFKNPKQEFEITAKLDYRNVIITLLDKISVDYPVIYLPGAHPLPICGSVLTGAWWTPRARWNFTIDPSDYFKVITRTIDPKSGTIRLQLRAI